MIIPLSVGSQWVPVIFTSEPESGAEYLKQGQHVTVMAEIHLVPDFHLLVPAREDIVQCGLSESPS